jgi:hypothetical protein
MEKNGDPRTGNPHDMVDWVELIPFEETRNYVQRVMEGYRVYRHHLEDQNVALIDFPGGNGYGPPPIPAPRPKDLSATETAAEPTSSDGPSHRPAFKPLGGSRGPAVAVSPEGASEGKRPSPAAMRRFDDQVLRRLAADDGQSGSANSPIN